MEEFFLGISASIVTALIIWKFKWVVSRVSLLLKRGGEKKELFRYGGSLALELDADLKSEPHYRLFFLRSSNLSYNVSEHCFFL